MQLEQVIDGNTLDAGSLSEKRNVSIVWSGSGGWLMLGAILAVLQVACGVGSTSELAAGSTGDESARATAESVSDSVSDFPIMVYTGADTLGGSEINFSDLRGQPVVLNFWAGLCPPCRAEMPDLQGFYDEFQDRTLMIGIDVGQFTGLGNQDDAQRLLEALQITYPSGFTSERAVMRDYGVFSMPTTVFITSEGQVFRKWSGALNQEKLAEITNEMVSQDPG